MSRRDLLEKARRLVDEKKVEIVSITGKYVRSIVEGDNGTYEVMIWFQGGNPSEAKCSCKWNILNHKSEDHWCSHIRSVLVLAGRVKISQLISNFKTQ